MKGGYEIVNNQTYSAKTSDSTVFGVYGGSELSNNLRWDLGYQYHTVLSGKNSIKINMSLIESALIYDFYTLNKLSLYGRFGVAHWGISKEESKSTLSDSGFSPLAETGVRYQLSKNMEIHGGYQYLDNVGTRKVGTYDSYTFVVGVKYKLGVEDDSSYSPIALSRTLTKQELEPKYVQPKYSFPLNQFPPLNFAVDSHEIDTEEVYIELVNVLKKHPTSRLRLIGYTDSQGDEKYNEILSENRANAVAKWFEIKGVNKEQMLIQSEGETNFKASNLTSEGRALNRRVEISILPFLSKQRR